VSDSNALERRYRRLLAWYPAQHRAVHGDEMIGVLLASAGRGQRRPRLADTVDLIKGGLQARLRQGRYGGADAGWRDTFAVAIVAVPAMLAVSWAVGIVIWAFTARNRIPSPAFKVSDLIPLIVPLIVIPLVAMLLIVLPPLAAPRYRRTAVFACVIAALFYAIFVPFLDRQSYSIAFLLEAVALLAGSGPQRGMRLLARKDRIALCSAGLALSVPRYLLAFPVLQSPPPPSVIVLSVSAAAAGFALLRMLPTPIGRRLTILLAIPAYPSFMWLTMALAGRVEAELVYAPTLALACVAAALILRSRHMRADTSGDPAPTRTSR
jgi:hypothetical protein